MSTQDAILVIYGLGKDMKPRAARFALADEETALRAAHAMGLAVARAETQEAISLAKGLPVGKPFATGKSLLPLARRDAYDKLIKAITPLDPKLITKAGETAALASTQPPAGAAGEALQNPWMAITVGALYWRSIPNLVPNAHTGPQW